MILTTGTWNRNAIDDFGSSIEVVRDTEAEVPTWRIEASDDVANLPLPEDGEWKDGDTLFFVAEVTGATSVDTSGNRVRWESTVEEMENVDNPDLAVPVHISWQPLELSPDDWDGEPEGVRLIDEGVYRKYDGAPLTARAFDREFPGLGKWLITIAAWLFAVSTMISWSYYGEQGMIYMLGQRSVLPYKFLYLAGVIFAAGWITETADMENLMDLGTGAMLWSNIPIVVVLGFLAVNCLKEYDRKLKAGMFKRRGVPTMEDVISGKDVE